MKTYFIFDNKDCDIQGVVISLHNNEDYEIRAALQACKCKDIANNLPTGCVYVESDFQNRLYMDFED